MTAQTKLLGTLILLFPLGWLSSPFILSAAIPTLVRNSDCQQLGWFPSEFGLKDHTVFFADGYAYIMSIYLPGETRFAYARSRDWCTWENLGPVLAERIPGEADERSIWSPFVLEENGVFYAFYTGVTRDFTQSILLATTTNPADPQSWRREGVIFYPTHPEAIWSTGQWSDCRDPMVLKVEDTYYLYYTGRDLGDAGEQGIIGLATAASLRGPWSDQGAIVTLPPSGWLFMLAIPESPVVYEYRGFYYLFYNHTSQGEMYRIGASPAGPWSQERPFRPGWAHEVWGAPQDRTYTSYLTDYTITIAPINWINNLTPPRPVIGNEFYQLFLSFVFKP